jgi:hypothetical protein
MKIILSESQFNRILSEQVKKPTAMPSATLTPSNQSSSLQPTTNVKSGTINSTLGAGTGLDTHTFMTLAQIATAFIPVAGPFISAGIGLADAALYYKEGDKSSAGWTAAFSMLPFAGKVVGKIPGVNKLGAKGMSALASKLSKGEKLSELEIPVAKSIAKYSKFVSDELYAMSQKLIPLTENIKKLKPKYIERFGQESYDRLLKDYLSGLSDRKIFLKSLTTGQKASPQLASFVTRFGIKFSKNEIDQIQKVIADIDDDAINIVKLETKNGPRTIRVRKVDGDWVAKNRPELTNSAAWANSGDDIVVINRGATQYMSSKEIDDLLMHEFGHIKDPSLVKSPVYQKLYRDEASKGIESLKMAADADAIKWAELGLEKPVDDIARLRKVGVQKYTLNPNEIIANNTMTLQSLATQTKRWAEVLPKKEILKGLDDIIGHAKGNPKSWSPEAERLLGYYYPYIKNHLETLATKPAEYQKLWVKLAQQAEYLKSQIKLAM